MAVSLSDCILKKITGSDGCGIEYPQKSTLSRPAIMCFSALPSVWSPMILNVEFFDSITASLGS